MNKRPWKDKKLSPAAKARAKKAGRPYPNWFDNAWASKTAAWGVTTDRAAVERGPSGRLTRKQLGMKTASFELGAIDCMAKVAEGAMYMHDGKLYHEIAPGVTAVIPDKKSAKKYMRDVGFVGSTAPTSKYDNRGVALGKAISRRLDAKNPNRPRYRSMKDFILRRPDPNYKPGIERRR